MSDKHPSTQRRQTETWDTILLRVIEIQGPQILQGILKEKAQQGRPPRPAVAPTDVLKKLASFSKDIRAAEIRRAPSRWSRVMVRVAGQQAQQARHRIAVLRAGWHQLRFGPGRSIPVEQTALEALSMAGFLGGVLFGLQLPQIDLKLSAKGKDKEALVLHAAALMATGVAAEWVQEILRRTLLAPTLSDGEARFLRGISRVLAASLRGVERGWSARQVAALWIRFWRSPKVKQHLVSTDARAVQIAQQLIESLRR